MLADNHGAVGIPGEVVLISHHHLFQRDNDSKTLVFHYGDGLSVVRLLQAAQRAGQYPAGAVGVMNFMPDDVGKVFFRFNVSARLQR